LDLKRLFWTAAFGKLVKGRLLRGAARGRICSGMTIIDGSSQSLSSVIAAAGELQAGKGAPPVHLWNPPHCGEIDIRIGRDGRWLHDGAPITRDALVRLFSTVLRKDADGFYLVTPVEKLKIVVEDAPFIAVQVESGGGVLRFLTNLGEWIEAGPDHPIRVETDAVSGEPAPYVHVRGGLEARMTRPVFYELVEIAAQRMDQDPTGHCPSAQARQTDAGPMLMVESAGAWFPLGHLPDVAQ
jgi:hypothetical protein